MTIATETNRVNYIGDGIIAQFSFTFKTTDDSHLKVYLDDVLQSADYTVTRNADQDISPGGVIDFTAGAPAEDVKVTLHREVPNTQLVDYSPYDPFPSETHENALDNLTMQVQQLGDEIDRTTKAPVSDDGTTDFTLPDYEAGKGLMWDPLLKKMVVSDVDLNGLPAASAKAENMIVSDSQGMYVGENVESILAEIKTKTYANRAEAITHDPVDGAIYFFGGTDGGQHKGVTGAAPGTYSNNGAPYCGTVSIPTGGDGSKAYLRIDGGFGHNIEWFGAIGDGVIDDTASIQTAISYVETINGEIFIPNDHTYLITSTLEVTEVIGIIGAGDRYSILNYRGSSGTYCIRYNHATAEVNQGQKLHNVYINGGDKLDGRWAVFCGGNQTMMSIRGCRFQHLEIAIELHASATNGHSYGDTIEDCQFWHIEKHAIWAYGNAEQFLFKHLWMTYGSLDTSDSTPNTDNVAILIEEATSGQIEGCVIQYHYDGISLRGCKPVSIRDCHFEDGVRYGIHLEGGTNYQNESINVTGCYVSDYEYGIALGVDPLGSGRTNYGTVLMSNSFTEITVHAIYGINGNASATGLNIIACSWYNDFTPGGGVDLVNNLDPVFLLSHDETISAFFKNLNIGTQLNIASSYMKSSTGTDLVTYVNGVLRTQIAGPGALETCLLLQYHNGTSPVFERVSVGAADSGGAGYRALRLPN